MKLNAAARTHLAKSVLSPISFTLGGFFSANAWKYSSMLLLCYAAIIFLGMQFLAVMLLSIEDKKVKKGEKKVM